MGEKEVWLRRNSSGRGGYRVGSGEALTLKPSPVLGSTRGVFSLVPPMTLPPAVLRGVALGSVSDRNSAVFTLVLLPSLDVDLVLVATRGEG